MSIKTGGLGGGEQVRRKKGDDERVDIGRNVVDAYKGRQIVGGGTATGKILYAEL